MDERSGKEREQELAKAAARFRAGLEMHRTGMQMLRMRLQREHPAASREQITEMINAWLRRRPLDGPSPMAVGAGDDR